MENIPKCINLTKEQMEKYKNWISTLPKLEHFDEVECGMFIEFRVCSTESGDTIKAIKYGCYPISNDEVCDLTVEGV